MVATTSSARQTNIDLLDPNPCRSGGTSFGSADRRARQSIGKAEPNIARLYRRPGQAQPVLRTARLIRFDRFHDFAGSRHCRAGQQPQPHRQHVELARRRRVPSDAQHQHLRDARHVVQSVGRQPVASASQRDNAAQPLNSLRRRTTTTEVGVKADVLDGKLTLAGAVFHIEKTNLRVPIDPVTNTGARARRHGPRRRLRSGAAGKLTDQWQVIASYTYVDARDRQDDRCRPSSTPSCRTRRPHNFSLWTTYDITPKWPGRRRRVLHRRTSTATPTNTALVPDVLAVRC